MKKFKIICLGVLQWLLELFPVFALAMMFVIFFGLGWSFGRKHEHTSMQRVLTQSDFDHADELDVLEAEVRDANEAVMDTLTLYGSCDQRTKVLEGALKQEREGSHD